VIDCDVIQADGGTRCASISGGFAALALAIQRLMDEGVLEQNPIKKQVAAISVGVLDGVPCLDLCYQEDSRADTDMNVIMSSNGGFIEIQGTAEGEEFDKKQLDTLLSLAKGGCQKIFKAQNKVLD
jgi:ribonuclease PH